MANDKNLIPISSRTARERKELGAKGGRASKGKPKFGMSSCKRCKEDLCPFKHDGTAKGWKCKMPEVKRLVLDYASDPSKISDSIAYYINKLGVVAANNPKDIKMVVDSLINFKKEIDPVTQHIKLENDNIPVIVQILNDIKKDNEDGEDDDG